MAGVGAFISGGRVETETSLSTIGGKGTACSDDHAALPLLFSMPLHASVTIVLVRYRYSNTVLRMGGAKLGRLVPRRQSETQLMQGLYGGRGPHVFPLAGLFESDAVVLPICAPLILAVVRGKSIISR